MQGAQFSITGTVDHLSDRKYTGDGRPMQPLTVKVEKKFKGESKTYFLNLMTIGEVAEAAMELKVGDPIHTQGAITSREYQEKHYPNFWANTIMKVSSVARMGGKKDETTEDDALPF